MHACGHDVHTTVGLGTAMVLSQLADELPVMSAFCFSQRETSEPMVQDGDGRGYGNFIFARFLHASWVNRCPVWLF